MWTVIWSLGKNLVTWSDSKYHNLIEMYRESDMCHMIVICKPEWKIYKKIIYVPNSNSYKMEVWIWPQIIWSKVWPKVSYRFSILKVHPSSIFLLSYKVGYILLGTIYHHVSVFGNLFLHHQICIVCNTNITYLHK